MNKAQLIDAIAEKAGLTKADSKKALEAVDRPGYEKTRFGESRWNQSLYN